MNNYPQEQLIEHTRLVFFGPLSLRIDDQARVEHGLLHSDTLGQTLPRPPRRTMRYKWTDALRGAIRDGSEYCVVKSPPPLEDDSQGQLFYSGLRGHYRATRAGQTQAARTTQRRTMIARQMIMIASMVTLALALLTLVIIPWASGEQDEIDVQMAAPVSVGESVAPVAGAEHAPGISPLSTPLP